MAYNHLYWCWLWCSEGELATWALDLHSDVDWKSDNYLSRTEVDIIDVVSAVSLESA
jgi:hypothetical protein